MLLRALAKGLQLFGQMSMSGAQQVLPLCTKDSHLLVNVNINGIGSSDFHLQVRHAFHLGPPSDLGQTMSRCLLSFMYCINISDENLGRSISLCSGNFSIYCVYLNSDYSFVACGIVTVRRVGLSCNGAVLGHI